MQEKKTGKSRHIYLDDRFKLIRDQVINGLTRTPTGIIFHHQHRGIVKSKLISITAANKRIKKAFTEYDIKCKNPSSHTLRKTFGRRIYEVHHKGEDALILLSHIFNHQNIMVTRRYIGLTEQRISNAYLSLSDGIPRLEGV